MHVDLGLFFGDELLKKMTIRISESECVDEDELIYLRHKLNSDENVASIHLRVLSGGKQSIRTHLVMPIHQSDDWESIELGEYTLAFRCRLHHRA